MKQDHVFFDVETTGVTDTDDITDMAAIRTDRKGKVLAAWSTKVAFDAQKMSKEVAEKVGYRSEDWIGAIPIDDALRALVSAIIAPFPEKYVVVAHFAEFDRRFIERTGKSPFVGRAWVDTSQVAWPLVYTGALASRSLAALAKYHSVGNTAPHTATGDVECLMHTYWVMMRRMSAATIATERIVEVAEGSDLVRSAMRYFGV